MRAKSVIPYGSLAPVMKGTMRSDARAKNEAYERGREEGWTARHSVDFPDRTPEFVVKERPRLLEKYRKEAVAKRINPKSVGTYAEARAREEWNGGKKYDAARHEEEVQRGYRETGYKDEERAATREARAKEYAKQLPPPATPTPAPAPAPAPPPSMWESARAFLSDMRTKDGEAVPYEEIGKSDKNIMRDGSSDSRTNSFDKTFHRDTPADRKRVKREFEDKAGRDADELLASFKRRSGEGPAVDTKRDAHVPDAAMFAAMKSMEPSVYAYKPEFRPAEQAPGELQAGPMANRMEKDPIAGMAIVREPGTGLRAIDKDKALKLTMGSLAVLANDVEKMKRKRRQ